MLPLLNCPPNPKPRTPNPQTLNPNGGVVTAPLLWCLPPPPPETSISLLNNQRQHRTSHAPKDPYAGYMRKGPFIPNPKQYTPQRPSEAVPTTEISAQSELPEANQVHPQPSTKTPQPLALNPEP